MEAFILSAGVIALAEIGDKTQLLALMMAARFNQPVAIICGMALAIFLNHALASAIGVWMTSSLSPTVLRWVLGMLFIGMTVWTLLPNDAQLKWPVDVKGPGVFGASLVTFFVAEVGDKTQVATVALAAHYGNAPAVIFGTTLGVLLVDAPVILIGHKVAGKIPARVVQWSAAAVFGSFGITTLLGVGPTPHFFGN
jgi:Ca2+/H+ antiporter, TMEM165/GDT1 family